MRDEIISGSDIMMRTIGLSGLQNTELLSVWKKVVSSVHSYKHESEDSDVRIPIGERLAGNTRLIDLKNGVLLIETDHPGWIQYLKLHQKYIITGLKKEIPDLKIKSLAYRIAGTNAALSESYDSLLRKEQKKTFEKMDKQDSEVEKLYKSEKKESKELPKELLDKFESMKNTLLTNSQK